MLMAGVAVVLAWSAFRSRDALYVAVVALTLFFMVTEVPLALHNYGFNFSVVLGALLLAIFIPRLTDHFRPGSEAPKRAARQDAHLDTIDRAWNLRADAGGQYNLTRGSRCAVRWRCANR
ncbi:hypothetical protein QF047_000801 [Arthrobacter sp. W4I7]|nr:hypothetical protein [Arthrobacter sp. W4I7]